jgi:hypothetical protein
MYMKNANEIAIGRPEVKRQLGRPRRRWKDIRMDLGKVGLEVADWIYLAHARDQWRSFVDRVINLRVP